MYDIVLAFISSLVLTYFAIPSIISIAKKKHIVDEPGERRSHEVSTPSLGGIGIFAGVIFSVILWTPFKYFGDLQYILSSFVIIFLIGAKDDIDPMSPYLKFAGQFLVAIILIFFSKIQITHFWGLFGLYDIPNWLSIMVTMLTIIMIINAFNLIDGINALSGSIGTLMAITFGTWFFMIDELALAIVAFSLAGSIIAFLRYNITPAKIFMGDTGSLLLGVVAAILAIEFIETNLALQRSSLKFSSAPAVAIGILILPIYDTLRVFVMRIITGRSPFSPDRNHIHHLLIDSGLSHMKATAILLIVNILFIFFVVKLHYLNTFLLLGITALIAITLSSLLYLIARRKKMLRQSV